MGKKNKGGINATRLALGGYDREMERFGIKGPTGGGRALEMQGLSGGDYRDEKDVERDMINAARNDYDLRRTLEAAAMSGKGKAQKILDRGFKNAGDITKALNFSEKAAKRHGQGGSFSSASDYMGLTQSMVERDRRKFTEANDAKYATKDELNALEQQEAAQAAFDDSEVELSPEVQAAKDRASAWSESGFGGNVYGDADPTATDASSGYLGGGEDEQDSSAVIPSDTEYEASQSYLSDFKNKLKDKGKFVSTI